MHWFKRGPSWHLVDDAGTSLGSLTHDPETQHYRDHTGTLLERDFNKCCQHVQNEADKAIKKSTKQPKLTFGGRK